MPANRQFVVAMLLAFAGILPDERLAAAQESAPGASATQPAPRVPSVQPRRRRRSRSDQPRLARSSDRAWSSAPNMMGDSTSGACGAFGFQTSDGALNMIVEHPTFACSRANIAENNSPIVRDRVYFTYRHFHNITPTNIFDRHLNDLDINRYTLGFEKTFFDGQASIELRAPINQQLSSDLAFSHFGSGSFGAGPPRLAGLPITDTITNWGNLTLIGKLSLIEGEEGMISGGLAVNVPTAPGVNIAGVIRDQNFPFDPNDPNDTGPVNLAFQARVENETVNLSPFLAAVWTPNERFFAQGFLQVDVAANPSRATLTIAPGSNIFGSSPDVTDLRTSIQQQTIFRTNLGAGFWHFHNPRATGVTGFASMIEIHHTTTLQEAKISRTAIFELDRQRSSTLDLVTGNLANRVDLVNLAYAPVIEFGRLTVQNAFVVPLSTGDNRAFDFEYSLLVNRRF